MRFNLFDKIFVLNNTNKQTFTDEPYLKKRVQYIKCACIILSIVQGI